MREETWRGFGFDTMDQAEAIAACESCSPNISTATRRMSNAAHLRGSAAWLNFRRIKCERWSRGNVILLGDAAHTAHFSIGSGTKLALEDAIKLAEVLNRKGLSLEAAMDEYVAERNLEVLKLQNSARNSTEWFETLDRYLAFRAAAIRLFAAHAQPAHQPREPAPAGPRMARRGRTLVLEARDRRPFEQDCAADVRAVQLRALQVENRITVSPMAMYSAADGTPNDFHFVHYGERAMGGAGLVFTEMTCVSPEAA